MSLFSICALVLSDPIVRARTSADTSAGTVIVKGTELTVRYFGDGRTGVVFAAVGRERDHIGNWSIAPVPAGYEERVAPLLEPPLAPKDEPENTD